MDELLHFKYFKEKKIKLKSDIHALQALLKNIILGRNWEEI